MKRLLNNLIGNALHHAGEDVGVCGLCVRRRQRAVRGTERDGQGGGD